MGSGNDCAERIAARELLRRWLLKHASSYKPGAWVYDKDGADLCRVTGELLGIDPWPDNRLEEWPCFFDGTAIDGPDTCANCGTLVPGAGNLCICDQCIHDRRRDSAAVSANAEHCVVSVPSNTAIICAVCGGDYDVGYSHPFTQDGARVCQDCCDGLGPDDLPPGLSDNKGIFEQESYP